MTALEVINGERRWSIETADALAWLKGLPDASVNCCVTSPPYWGLRDYGVEGQLGLERTPQEYVERMVEVFRGVWRVLREDGTLWLNLGDSYANDTKWGGQTSGKHAVALHGKTPLIRTRRTTGMKPKDLVGIPWRVAFALQADGWYLRQDIIWAKPNPMPESVTDRCTKSHEYLFLLTKSKRYYFNADAIAEPVVKGAAGSEFTKGKTGTHQNGRASKLERVEDNSRNKRSVWTIATESDPAAHFATMPNALAKPCILAGCPADGIVMDPFSGSGTTLRVALDLGCRAIGCDLNPQYVETIAIPRLESTTPGMFQ